VEFLAGLIRRCGGGAEEFVVEELRWCGVAGLGMMW
jgi:hypothetical protein